MGKSVQGQRAPGDIDICVIQTPINHFKGEEARRGLVPGQLVQVPPGPRGPGEAGSSPGRSAASGQSSGGLGSRAFNKQSSFNPKSWR